MLRRRRIGSSSSTEGNHSSPNTPLGAAARASASVRGLARSVSAPAGAWKERLLPRRQDKKEADAAEGGSASRCDAVTDAVRRYLGVDIDERRLRAQALALLRNNYYGTLLGFITIFSLLGDDLRLAATRPSADDTFFALAAVTLGIFIFDLALSCYARPKYVGSFNFWVDVVSTIATIPDIGWLWDAIVGTESDGNADFVREGAASASTARASRILRVVRLLRLLRVAKLWVARTALDRRKQRRLASGMSVRSPSADSMVSEDARESRVEPSRVSKRLNEQVTKNLMICVLALVLVLPLFDGQVIFVQTNEWQARGLARLHHLAQDFDASNGTFRDALDQYLVGAGRLIYLEVCEPPSGCTTPYSRESELYPWLEALRFQPLRGNGEVDTAASYSLVRNPVTKFRASELFDDVSTIYRRFRSAEVQVRRESTCWDADGVSTARASPCLSVAVFDDTSATQLEALLSMAKTFLVMVVVIVGVLLMHQDAQHLVVGPIERMVEVVQALAENPLRGLQTTTKPGATTPQAASGDATYESALLERTLRKIGALVTVGFGAAGAEIIKRNMHSAGEIDPMVPGRLITAIYGFCDIRNFTDTTECLEDDVMLFVNCLGAIVHNATHAHHGMANKNIGDAFLLSWKLCDGKLPGFSDFSDPSAMDLDHFSGPRQKVRKRTSARDLERTVPHQRTANTEVSTRTSLTIFSTPAPRILASLRLKRSPTMDGNQRDEASFDDDPFAEQCRVKTAPTVASGDVLKLSPEAIANHALAAFVGCILDIRASNASGRLRDFTQHPAVVARFGENFKIKMGFGLHVGWAVEGAIGTALKIDATYISPHVEMSDRLEAGSKIFGVPLNMSHWFAGLLPEATQDKLRPLDRILVSGCSVPMTVYTLDLSEAAGPVASAAGTRRVSQEKLLGILPEADMHESPEEEEVARQGRIHALFAAVQEDMPQEFRSLYTKGFRAYECGFWADARRHLKAATHFKAEDPPTKRLLAYMNNRESAPPGWEGYRRADDY